MVVSSGASPSDQRYLRCYSVTVGQNGGCHSESFKRVSNQLFSKKRRVSTLREKRANVDAKMFNTCSCFIPKWFLGSCSFSCARHESVSFRLLTKQHHERGFCLVFFFFRNKRCVFARHSEHTAFGRQCRDLLALKSDVFIPVSTENECN